MSRHTNNLQIGTGAVVGAIFSGGPFGFLGFVGVATILGLISMVLLWGRQRPDLIFALGVILATGAVLRVARPFLRRRWGVKKTKLASIAAFVAVLLTLETASMSVSRLVEDVTGLPVPSFALRPDAAWGVCNKEFQPGGNTGRLLPGENEDPRLILECSKSFYSLATSYCVSAEKQGGHSTRALARMCRERGFKA